MTRHASTAPTSTGRRWSRRCCSTAATVDLGWEPHHFPSSPPCWPRLKPPNSQSGRTSTRCAAPSRSESLAAASSANAPANARIEQFGGYAAGTQIPGSASARLSPRCRTRRAGAVRNHPSQSRRHPGTQLQLVSHTVPGMDHCTRPRPLRAASGPAYFGHQPSTRRRQPHPLAPTWATSATVWPNTMCTCRTRI